MIRSFRRQHYLTRMKFHDWLWQGSADGKRFRSWLGPKLPIYLSDPELPATKRGRQKLFDSVRDNGVPTIGPEEHAARLAARDARSHPGFYVSAPTLTIGNASSTFTWIWR